MNLNWTRYFYKNQLFVSYIKQNKGFLFLFFAIEKMSLISTWLAKPQESPSQIGLTCYERLNSGHKAILIND